MTLGLLYLDEMRGFYKSYVMLTLWVGLPALTIALHFLQPIINPLYPNWPLSYLVSTVIGGLGGILASVTLSTALVSERNQRVYDLFLIRPVRRSSLILAKFGGIYTCLTAATIISLASGILLDALFKFEYEPLLSATTKSLVISLSAMAIACSLAILIGIVVSSVGLAAILAILTGDVLMLIPMLPTYIDPSADPVPLGIMSGLIITVIVLALTVYIFNRKQF